MKVLSKAEAQAWCRGNAVPLCEHGLPERPSLAERFEIPIDSQKRVYLVSERMSLFKDEVTFLMWFDDWAVWPSGQRMHVFERFRLSYGERRPLIDSPGHLFDKADFEDAVSFMTIAVLFLWDCYVLTPRAEKFLFFSHDEFGLMGHRDDALH